MTENPLDRTQEMRRDIDAALEDMRARRAQAVSQYDDKLAQIESLRGQLDAGTSDLRLIRDQLRHLIGERGTGPIATRAGRTTIGMTTPGTGAPVRSAQSRPNVTPALAAAALTRARDIIDTKIGMVVATAPAAADGAPDTRIELSLLRQMRRSAERLSEEAQNDVVLLESVTDLGDETQKMLDDLASSPVARAKRLVSHCREMLAQLHGLGVLWTSEKEELKAVQASLSSAAAGAATIDPQPALRAAATVYRKAQPELEKRLAAARPTLLDSLSRP